MGAVGVVSGCENEDIFLSEVWNKGEKAIKGRAALPIFVRAPPITCYIIILPFYLDRFHPRPGFGCPKLRHRPFKSSCGVLKVADYRILMRSEGFFLLITRLIFWFNLL